MRYMTLLAVLGFGCSGLVACVEQPVAGNAVYAQDCAGCHGTDARGNGPVARRLGVEAPDLTMIAARNGGVFPRDRVMSVIDGLNRDAHFNTAMPEFGAGDMGDTVIYENAGLGTPVPERLLALADYLGAIQRP